MSSSFTQASCHAKVLFLMMYGILVATQLTEALPNLAMSYGSPNLVSRCLRQGNLLLMVLQSFLIIA